MESWGRPQWRIRLALWGRGQSHLLRVVVQAGGERWKFGTVSGYGADIWLIINKSLKGQFWWPDWGWRPAIAWGEDEFSAVFASKCFWTRVMGACNCEGIQMPYEKVVQMITQKWATRGGDDGLWEDKRTKCMSASMMVKSMDGGGGRAWESPKDNREWSENGNSTSRSQVFSFKPHFSWECSSSYQPLP